MSIEKVSEALTRIAARGDVELLNDLITIARGIEESENPKAMAEALLISATGAIGLVPAFMQANNAIELAKEGRAMLDHSEVSNASTKR